MKILTVATNLVTRESVHPATRTLVLQALSAIDHGSALLGTKGRFPSLELASYTADPEAERYFSVGLPFIRRHFPYWLANLIERFYAFLLPLATIAIPLFRFLPNRVKRFKAKMIERWYERLRAIERAVTLAPRDLHSTQQLAKRLDVYERELELHREQISDPQAYFMLRSHVDRVRRHFWRVQMTGWLDELEHRNGEHGARDTAQDADGGALDVERLAVELVEAIDKELNTMEAIERRCEEARIPAEFFSEIRDVRSILARARGRLERSADAAPAADPTDAGAGTVREMPQAMPERPRMTLIASREPNGSTQD